VCRVGCQLLEALVSWNVRAIALVGIVIPTVQLLTRRGALQIMTLVVEITIPRTLVVGPLSFLLNRLLLPNGLNQALVLGWFERFHPSQLSPFRAGRPGQLLALRWLSRRCVHFIVGCCEDGGVVALDAWRGAGLDAV
jgi:hypothetical protein